MKHLKFYEDFTPVDNDIKPDLLKSAAEIMGSEVESESDITDYIENNIENTSLQTIIDKLTDIKKEIKKLN